jgi:hypothetical protein
VALVLVVLTVLFFTRKILTNRIKLKLVPVLDQGLPVVALRLVCQRRRE